METMSATMMRRSLSGREWAPWAAVLAVSLACGAQAARLAWPEYEMSMSDPGFRRQAPETLERVRLASTLEMAGQPKAAEHELLIAAAGDRRFLSAWALANFYHRQNRDADFWPWARRAAAMSHGDRTALFALLLARGSASRVREILPPELHPAFGAFLISAGRLDEAIAALADLDAASSRVLAERLIAARRFADALAVWTRTQPPAEATSDFRHPPSGLGFDWRLGPQTSHAAGRLVIAGASPPGEFASRYLALEPSRRYRLTVEQEAASAAGALRWQIDDLAGGNLLREAPLVDPAVQRQRFEFRTSSRTRFVRLALASSTSVRGVYAVRRVSVDLAD
jgi:hypothetical protein